MSLDEKEVQHTMNTKISNSKDNKIHELLLIRDDACCDVQETDVAVFFVCERQTVQNV